MSMRIMAAIGLALAVGFTAAAAEAKDKVAKSNAGGGPAAKAGKGEKVCRYKFPTGEKRAWVCKKEEPCCAWDAINYVKCGSTVTGCL